MKKTLLVTALTAVLSTSAYAVPVYQQDTTEVDLYGRLGAFFGKTERTNTDIFDDASRLGLKVKHGVNGDLEAIGGLEFRFSDAEKRFSDPTTHDAYVGLKHKGYGALTVGRQATTADDIALSKFAYFNEDVTLSPVHGDRTIKFRSTDYDLGTAGKLGFGVDHTFLGTNDKNVDVKSRSTGAGLFYSNTFGDLGFKLNGGYTHTQLKNDTIANAKNREKSWIVGTQFSLGQFDLGVDYAQNDFDIKENTTGLTSPTVASKATQVALRYRATDGVSVFTAYQYGRNTFLQEKVKKHQYTIGADYKLHKNVLAYAQLDTVKVKSGDQKDTDVGGAVGMRVLF